jgi:hypothetical protein
MTMKKTAFSLPMIVLAVLLLVASQASADTISLVLSNPVQTGAPGSTLSFDATVSAPLGNGATVYLNGDNYGIDIAGPSPIDDSGFLLGFPLSLDPGDSSTGTLFTVALPSGLAPGIYNGFFEIAGGVDPSALDELVTVDFQINAESPVPEPGTWILFATGLCMLTAGTIGRRHLSQKNFK